MRREFRELAERIMETPPAIRSEMAERFLMSGNVCLGGIGAAIQENTPLNSELLAIGLASAVRRAYLDDQLTETLRIIPPADSGALWAAFREACAEEVTLAEIDDIDALLRED